MTKSLLIVASAFGFAHAQDAVTFENTDVVESSTYDPINDVWVGGNSRGNYLTVATPTSSKNTPAIDGVTTTQGMYYSNNMVYAVGLDFPANWDGKNSTVAQLLKFDVTNGPVCGEGTTCDNAPTIVDVQPVVEQAGFATSQLNDIVVTSSGTAYITDSWNGALYTVRSNNVPSLFLNTPPEWAPVQSTFGALKLSANGIEHFTTTLQQEYLLVTLTLTKDSLYRVSIPSVGTPTVTKVQVLGDSTWAENIGNDGIRFLPLPLYKNPWENVMKVTHQSSCDCAVDAANVQTMPFFTLPDKIYTGFVPTSNCNSYSTIALVHSGDISGFSHTLKIAVDGDLTNTPDNLPSVLCTMAETTGDISCTFDTCVNTFSPERPDKFLGVVGLDTTVRMLYSSNDFSTAELVGVDNRTPSGFRTTLGIQNEKIFINDLGSFEETASTTTKPFEYQSDWDLVDPSKGDSGCCRFNEGDRWAAPGVEKAVRTTSLSACQEACSADSSCNAIEYVPRKFKCEIHTATPSFASTTQENCLCLLNPDAQVSSGSVAYLNGAIFVALMYVAIGF